MANQTTGTAAVGQLDPYVPTSDFAVIAFIVKSMIARLDTMKPVQVQAVHGGGGAVAAAGTVDVQLLVSAIDPSGNAVPAGVVYGVPWWRLQGGPSAVIADPVKGDLGYVVCADRDISNLKSAVAGGRSPLVNPGSFRRMNVADGVYIGGILNGPPTQYLRFRGDGLDLVDLNGNVVKTTATGITMTDVNGSQIQMKPGGIVNVVCTSFEVNGVPVTVP